MCMCLKIRCDKESEKFCKTFYERLTSIVLRTCFTTPALSHWQWSTAQLLLDGSYCSRKGHESGNKHDTENTVRWFILKENILLIMKKWKMNNILEEHRRTCTSAACSLVERHGYVRKLIDSADKIKQTTDLWLNLVQTQKKVCQSKF